MHGAGMRLQHLGPDAVVVHGAGELRGGRFLTVLFSYETPVAGFDGEKWFRTDHFWSKTTTKHINNFFKGFDTAGIDIHKVSQKYIEELF